MIREKIKAGDFFTLYNLDDAAYNAVYPKHYCWPIISIARAITVNTEQQYIGCNMIYPPRYSDGNIFYHKIDLGGWRWRYDFEFFNGKNGIRSRRSTSNEIFRYVSEFFTYVQDLEVYE